MVPAFYVRSIRDRFLEQIPVCRVDDSFGVFSLYEMAGIIFACYVVDPVYIVSQFLTQLMAKKPGESDLPASQKEIHCRIC